MSLTSLLKIVSGETKGPFAVAVRLSLACLTPFYRLGVYLRNRRFDTGNRTVDRVTVPVISIGNITTGGTGKTPMVVWICKTLQANSIHPGIVSRGYGAAELNQTKNDEAMELENRLPDVPHEQDADRVAAARRCIENEDVAAIVVDDGFQHRRLGRDLDVVLIDASNPFGYGRLLPRGLLREPVASLSRSDVILITRCDRVNREAIEGIKKRINQVTNVPVALSRTRASAVIQNDGSETKVENVKARRWFAFSAIGNPSAFENSLNQAGFSVAGTLRFRDHHTYSQRDFETIVSHANSAGATDLICTHKDLVKVKRNSLNGFPVYAFKIDLEIIDAGEDLERMILDLFDQS